MTGSPPAIVFVVNSEWYFLSHRLPLALALRDRGFRVIVASRSERGEEDVIRQHGLTFVDVPLRRRSLNPVADLGFLASLIRLYRRERPDLVHHLTVKPVVYGSLAARLRPGLPVVNAVPGLGWVFSGGGARRAVLRKVALLAYRAALSGSNTRVILQQSDDLRYLKTKGVLDEQRAVVIRGSGVDPRRFSPRPEPSGTPVVLMASRLLWDKGVGEFVEAARRLKEGGVALRAVLAGDPDRGNPAAIPDETLRGWERSGLVEWQGWQKDMPDLIASSSVVVFPSTYAEGIPKVLLEAGASGRAVVTTDRPGCRDAVIPGETGLLVPPRDPQALARAIGDLLRDPDRRREMGQKGRDFVVREFTEEQVVRQTLSTYQELLPDGPAKDALTDAPRR